MRGAGSGSWVGVSGLVVNGDAGLKGGEYDDDDHDDEDEGDGRDGEV